MAIKRPREGDVDDGVVIASKLTAYGEAFMRMFDDYDQQQPLSKQQQKQRHSQPQHDDHVAQQHISLKVQAQQTSNSSEAADDDAELGGSDDESSEETGQGRTPSQVERFLFGGGKGAGLRHQRPAATAAAPTGGVQAQHDRRPPPGFVAGAAPAPPHLHQQQQAAERRVLKKLKRGKLGSLFDAGVDEQLQQAQQQRGRGAGEEEGGVSDEEFGRMQKEVELLGASALDKRQLKRWKAAQLARLGAQAEKGPRINAKIGQGMARKAKQREAKSLDEAIEAGMVQRKGLGKKRRQEEKGKPRDWGLQEAGPGFKNGVLRVKVSKDRSTGDARGGRNGRGRGGAGGGGGRSRGRGRAGGGSGRGFGL